MTSSSYAATSEQAGHGGGYARAQLAVLDMIADGASIEPTLKAIGEAVEVALPSVAALVFMRDESLALRGFANGTPTVDLAKAHVHAELRRLDAEPMSHRKQASRTLIAASDSVWFVPVVDPATRPLGALCILRRSGGRPTEGETELIRSASTLTQIAIEHHLAEWRALELLAAERRRLARDVHDDPVQAMTVVSLHLQRMAIEATSDQREMLGQMRHTVDHAIDRMRRMLFELHPTMLDEEGLAVAVEVCLEETLDSLGVEWQIDVALHSEPDPHIAALAYRVIQQALVNVAAHAGATTVKVELGNRDDGMMIRIVDDGCGFDPKSVSRNRPGHLGLHTAYELARRASGTIEIRSAPGDGCTVELWLPNLSAS
jgi:signal transduction histidine kinase